MKVLYKGTGTALITPFTEDGVDFPALERLIEYQIESGIDSLVVLGTTGEAATLTDEEYADVAEFALKKIAGRVKAILANTEYHSYSTRKRVQPCRFHPMNTRCCRAVGIPGERS